MTTTDTVPAATRPGLQAWVRLTVTEGKLVARDTAGLLIPLALPLLIMVMNGLGQAGGEDARGVPEFGGLSPMEAIVLPLTLGMIVAVVGMVNMPSFLASYRKTGVLRRLSVTPAHPAMVLAAQVLVSIAQTLLGLALALGVAFAAFDLVAPRRLAAAVGVFALTAMAMYALGMLVAAISPTPNASVAIGLMAFFAVLALGGGFGPRENLPDALATVGEHLPFGAGVEALGDAWIGESVDPSHLLALVVAIVVAGALAATRFRWE